MGDNGLPIKTLIEGNKIVSEAIIIPKNVVDKLAILWVSASLSKSPKITLREDFSVNLLFTKCFDLLYLKSSYLLKV